MATSHTGPIKIAVIPGDGIGKEVMPWGVKCIQAAAKKYGNEVEFTDFDFASAEYYTKHGDMLPKDWVQTLKQFDAIYFGAVGWPDTIPDHITLWGSLLKFRREFDQYVNMRPVRLIPGVKSPLANPKNIDFLIVRENTEGEYTELGGRLFHGTEREFVIQEIVMTKIGVDRIVRFAFEQAMQRKKHLTSATKSNGMGISMPYWDERVRAISKEYPEVKWDQFHIDALCAKFVLQPDYFDVVVGSNLFGDLLSDLGPALTGALGIAPSGNLNPTREMPSLFEPVHGSAPDIYGKNIANPVGMIWAGQMLLEFFGKKEAATDMLKAIDKVLGRHTEGEITPDMQGKGNTDALGAAILKEIEGA